MRYGNGIEFVGESHDELVEGCRIHDIYDSGLSNQSYLPNTIQERIYYRNNLVWNSGYASFEYWSSGAGSRTTDVRFEQNTCAFAGEGWGGDQDRGSATSTSGANVRLDQTPPDTTALSIRNNVFYGARLAGMGMMVTSSPTDWPGLSQLALDSNAWHGAPAMWVFFNPSTGIVASYAASDAAACRKATGKDANSIVGDPLLVDPVGADFRLRAQSPARGAGTPLGIATDITGAARPATPDVGAYQY